MVEHNLSRRRRPLATRITVLARGEILAEGDYATVSKNPRWSRPTWGPAHAADEPLLAVRGLHAWYGESHILHGVDFDVREGEVVTLLGRNGAGKTTTLKSIMGMVGRSARARSASTAQELIGLPSNRIARLGIAFCPEERGIFASLNVRGEPAAAAAGARRAASRSSRSTSSSRTCGSGCASQGTKLSGGEQQMLAIGRILRTGARLLLLDEPTEGLAPGDRAADRRAPSARLKREGFTILLVEQNFRFAATVADRHYVMEHGRVVDMIPNAELEASMDKLHDYLGV